MTRTRAWADAIAASADFTRAADTAAADSRAGERRVGRDAVLHQPALAIEIADVLVARRDRLAELRLGLGHRAPRRLELRVDVGVLDLGDDLALAHARAFFEPDAREPPADLHADVAAVARDDVAGGDEDGEIGRAAGGGDHLVDARDLHFGRAPLVDRRRESCG